MKNILAILSIISVLNGFSQNNFYLRRINTVVDENPIGILNIQNSSSFLFSCNYKNLSSWTSSPIIFKGNNCQIVDSLLIDTLQGFFVNFIQINPNLIAVTGLTKNYTSTKDNTNNLSSTNYSISFWTMDTLFNILSYKSYKTNFEIAAYLFNTYTSKKDFAITATGQTGPNTFCILYALLDSLGNLKDSLRYLNTTGLGFGYNMIEQDSNKFLSFADYSGFVIYGTAAGIVQHDSLLRVVGVDTIPPKRCGIYSMMTAKAKNKHEYYLCGKNHDVVNNHDYFSFNVTLMDSVDHVEKTILMGSLDTVSYPSAFRSLDFINYNNIYTSYTYNAQLDYPWTTQPAWVVVTKLDSMLNIRWQKYVGGGLPYYSNSILATQDGGCYVTGTFYDSTLNIQQRDIFILRFDSLGNTISGVPDNAYVFDTALVYPNPGTNNINVLMPENFKATTFELYNSVGVLCKEEQFGNDRLNLNTNELKCGLYFYRLRQGNNIVSQGKWVKE